MPTAAANSVFSIEFRTKGRVSAHMAGRVSKLMHVTLTNTTNMIKAGIINRVVWNYN